MRRPKDSGSAVNELIWLANVDSAMAASTLSRLGTLSTAAADHFDAVITPVPRSSPPYPRGFYP